MTNFVIYSAATLRQSGQGVGGGDVCSGWMDGGVVWRMWTRTGPPLRRHAHVDTLSTRTPPCPPLLSALGPCEQGPQQAARGKMLGYGMESIKHIEFVE